MHDFSAQHRAPASPNLPAPQLCYERVEPARRRLALSLLLSGRCDPRDSAVDSFLHYASEHQLGLDDLWLCSDGVLPLAACLIVANPGRTGLLFLSPLSRRSTTAAASELVRRACATIDLEQVHLVQALMEPMQHLETQALCDAGFRELANLIYMQRRGVNRVSQLELGPDLQIIHWSPQNRPLFEQAILATYEQTLDCPGLLGLRHIDDIIAGHMSAGQFLPDLWHCLLRDGQPVGVMLLNLLPPHEALELVYLGLSPQTRGCGLAHRLLDHALSLPRHYGVSSLVLAVDQNNAPAMRLYRQMQFASYAHKLALMLPLAKKP